MKKSLFIILWIIAVIAIIGLVFIYFGGNKNYTCNAYVEGYVCIENTCKLQGNSGCNPKPIGYSTIEECELNCGE